jgi:hypothetical protein
LKKQSQFFGGQNDINNLSEMTCGDFGSLDQRKNKPNQSQSQLAPRPALGVEKTNPIMGWLK